MPTDLETILKMEPCPELQGTGRGLLDGETHVPFCRGNCKGSGERPLFPELWTKCPGQLDINSAVIKHTETHGGSWVETRCLLCSGTGFVPNVTEGTLLKELLEEDAEILIRHWANGGYWVESMKIAAYDTVKDALIAELASSVVEKERRP